MNTSGVFIIDDDLAVRESIALLLSTEGYEPLCFSSAEEFLEHYDPDWSGCLILDVKMPQMSGEELYEELQKRGTKLRTIFLTAHGTIPMSVRSMKAGAENFLTKPVQADELIACVESALQRSSDLETERKKLAAHGKCVSGLSPRELEILLLALTGKSNKDIANELGISYRTVEIHRSHILLKTGKSNMLELAELVGEMGLRNQQET